MTLNFKSTLTAISSLMLFWTATGTAAPSCKYIFRTFTQNEINATLDKLAELRMNLDLEKASGPIRTTSKTLKKDYREKEEQALSVMNIDLATLQKDLQRRIERLQASKNERDQSDRNVRSTEARSMKLGMEYNLKAEVLDINASNEKPFRAAFYSPKSNSLFYFYFNELHRLDIDSKNIQKLTDTPSTFDVNHTRNQLFAITQTGKLSTIDLTTGISDSPQPQMQFSQKHLRFINRVSALSMSPSGKKAAVAFRGESDDVSLLIFDATTGELLKELDGPSSGIMKFWTEDEVVLTRKFTVKKVNINTEVVTTSSIAAGVPEQLSLNAESNTIFFLDAFGKLKTFTGDKLELLDTTNQFTGGRIAEIPGRPDLVAIFAPQTRDNLNGEFSGIYRRDDLTHPVFDFKGEYLSEKKIPRDIVISKDLSQIFIFHYQYNDTKINVDIWTRKQGDK